jgi:hypothetical protein
MYSYESGWIYKEKVSASVRENAECEQTKYGLDLEN